MEWYHIAATVFGNFAWSLPLFLWIRSEANSDRRELRSETDSSRREIASILQEMKAEMKDFHGRLCTIEEKYNQIIQTHLDRTSK